jgi:hypothetical protein
VRGDFGHPASIAGRANTSAFAGESDQKVMATVRAAGAGKTVGEKATGQVLAEVPFDVCGDWLTVRIPAARLRQPRFQMPLHHLIDHRTFRPPRLVHRGAR